MHTAFEVLRKTIYSILHWSVPCETLIVEFYKIRTGRDNMRANLLTPDPLLMTMKARLIVWPHNSPARICRPGYEIATPSLGKEGLATMLWPEGISCSILACTLHQRMQAPKGNTQHKRFWLNLYLWHSVWKHAFPCDGEKKIQASHKKSKAPFISSPLLSNLSKVVGISNDEYFCLSLFLWKWHHKREAGLYV